VVTISDQQPNRKQRNKMLFTYLASDPQLALKPYQAAGAVGNSIHESAGDVGPDGKIPNIDPEAVNPAPSHATGIFQWLGNRKTSMLSFQYKGLKWNNVLLQAAFAKNELLHSESSALAALRATTNIEDATSTFETLYERGGSAGASTIPNRINNAKAVLAAFSNSPLAPVTFTGCTSGLDPLLVGNASAQAVKDAADKLDAMHLPYAWGGGHTGTPAVPSPDINGKRGPDGKVLIGLDCSGAVSWVLQHAGIKVDTTDSTGLESYGDPGPGKAVTIYANSVHTFLKIGSRYFGTSGFGHPSKGTGAAWFDVGVQFPGGYLAGFVPRHPPGL
jgi:cell wall-associated NlpC family hydrolase